MNGETDVLTVRAGDRSFEIVISVSPVSSLFKQAQTFDLSGVASAQSVLWQFGDDAGVISGRLAPHGRSRRQLSLSV